MKIGEAKRIAGTLSYPSKMPGTGYALPATACKLGSKLAKIPGAVCAGCYAMKGDYRRGNALKGMQRRLLAISHPEWVEAIVALLLWQHGKFRIKVDLGAEGVRRQRAGGERHIYNEPGFHRWHDSGDLQSVEHLAKICEVARRTPRIKHWLPTNELGMVVAYLESGGMIPGNLLIRVSSIRVNDHRRRSWPHTSSVFNGLPPTDSHLCPAPIQGHRCGSCRACWSADVPHVVYEQH